MTNAELIDSLRNVYGEKADCYHCHSTVGCYGTACMEYLCHAAADALEAAEKRIAILEEERDLERFAAKNYLDKIDELEAQIPKEGEWIDENRRTRSSKFVCSICKRTCYDIQPTRDKAWTKRCRYAYCPNCGCRMDGETEYVSTYSLGKISVPNGAIKQIIEDGKEQTDE